MGTEQPIRVDKETRRYVRVPFLGRARVTMSRDNRDFRPLVDNVNRGGVGLFFKQSLPLRDEVVMKLEFTNMAENEASVKIEGKIVHATSWNRIFIIGIEFDALLNPSKHADLYLYIMNAETA